jgi:uncharacterized protein (DUF4415 family)
MKSATTLKPPSRTSRKPIDPDNPPWTEAMLGPSRVRAGRGAPSKTTKVATTIRLDRDVIEHFRASGRDYQARMNKVLRDAMRRERSGA